jgi:Pentapeptide repeats (8 copies)
MRNRNAYVFALTFEVSVLRSCSGNLCGVECAAMVCVPEPIDILRCGPAEWSQILRRGPRAWNAWRDDYPWIIPDLTRIAPTLIECQLGPLSGGPINLATARLRGARLGRATLSEANLEGADLADADLSYARLDRANLSYANLRNANLDKADLAGARLMRADLSGANLAQSRGLTQGQFFGSIGNSLTVLPHYVERPQTWPEVGSEIRDERRKLEQVVTKPIYDDKQSSDGARCVSSLAPEHCLYKFWLIVMSKLEPFEIVGKGTV